MASKVDQYARAIDDYKAARSEWRKMVVRLKATVDGLDRTDNPSAFLKAQNQEHENAPFRSDNWPDAATLAHLIEAMETAKAVANAAYAAMSDQERAVVQKQH